MGIVSSVICWFEIAGVEGVLDPCRSGSSTGGNRGRQAALDYLLILIVRHVVESDAI
ncbi:hypothetical protein [Mesorhizobium sp. M1365]|uniref:hypothetical protein n=1 Tax=Mesorhizobium sp. M1365 TaxID=2957090 RepID=UPI00333527FD